MFSPMFATCKYLLLIVIHLNATTANEVDPASDQLVNFKERTQIPIGIMTTHAGAPVEKTDTGSILNRNLLENEYFVETLAHFVRERIPVRVVHTKGAGAFGYFITTHDISDKCRAAFLRGIGKTTPVAARFSISVAEKGGSDLTISPRGFALKFYTEEGNFDIVGLNIPIFAFKDPSLFSSFIHSVKNNPVTDFADVNMLWDFMTMHPETLFCYIMSFSGNGIPDGYGNMPGYSVHTYAIYNAAGTISYARFHFRPYSGIKYLNATEAARLTVSDPDYSARDLYNSIARGDYPTWIVSVQLMSEEDVKNATMDPFDISKLIPESQVPLLPIGKLILNRNPKNYFAEVEQLAFCPANLVPGILGAPDKAFEARRFIYKDAQRYRLGPNFEKISVNCPFKSNVFTYSRDGQPPVNGNEYDAPNYYPNSFNGPLPYEDKNRPSIPNIYEAEANNFDQARDYYTNQLTNEQRNILIQNIISSLCNAAQFLQERAVEAFTRIHYDLANRIAKSLRVNSC